MKDVNQELVFLQEAVPQLHDYLISDELYWPLRGSLPRLTLGSLLLAVARLKILAPSEVHDLMPQVETIHARWRSAWEKKASREISNRVRLWSHFLSDQINEPDRNFGLYISEVRVRVILQLLFRELPEAPEKSVLANLDDLLMARLLPSEFIWESELKSYFLKTEFWFLYGKL